MVLQIDTIILGVCNLVCSNYSKQQVFYFLPLSSERSEWWSFLHADKVENYLQIDTTIFNGDGQAFPKFPK